MKSNEIKPTLVERVLPADRYIVSTTDGIGRITSVNDVFLEYAGYEESELIGVQHNIVRHPDMPRSVSGYVGIRLNRVNRFMAI